MIHDAFTKFASGQRPTLSLLGGANGIPDFYAFPEGALGANTSFDLKSAIDKGIGTPLLARMDITQTFTTAGTISALRFAVAISDSEVYSGVDQLLLCEGQALSMAEMAAQRFYELTIPKLSSVHSIGRRYLLLGMIITTTITLGNPLFTAGALDAYILLSSDTAPRNPPYTSGWNAKGL